MYQLRIYILRTAEALEDYATALWPPTSRSTHLQPDVLVAVGEGK